MSYDPTDYADGWERTFGSKSERARREREFIEQLEKRIREMDDEAGARNRALFRRVK